ncbi:TPA: hypothetical protein DCX15_00470 [bacterium]|nr:hypothetical protein [bacterium]
MREGEKEDLTGTICPRVGCGVLVPSKNGWRCNKCNEYIKDRATWWERMEVFQNKACIDALKEILKEKPQESPLLT